MLSIVPSSFHSSFFSLKPFLIPPHSDFSILPQYHYFISKPHLSTFVQLCLVPSSSVQFLPLHSVPTQPVQSFLTLSGQYLLFHIFSKTSLSYPNSSKYTKLPFQAPKSSVQSLTTPFSIMSISIPTHPI